MGHRPPGRVQLHADHKAALGPAKQAAGGKPALPMGILPGGPCCGFLLSRGGGRSRTGGRGPAARRSPCRPDGRANDERRGGLRPGRLRDGRGPFGRKPVAQLVQRAPHGGDVLGRGAAATPDDGRAGLGGKLPCEACEILRDGHVHEPVAHPGGQTRVGHRAKPHARPGRLPKRAHRLQHRDGPGAAVDAYHVRPGILPQLLQGLCGLLRGSPVEGSPLGRKAQLGHHG